jgi:hypothetical protein
MHKTNRALLFSLRLLLIWFLMLVLPTLLSAQSAIPTLTPAQTAIAKAYSIDPALKYPGYSVVQGIDKILQDAEAEAKARAGHAWDSGYKQAVLEWKPKYDGATEEISYWKDLLLKEKKAHDASSSVTGWAIAGGVVTSVLSFIAGHFLF